MNFELSFFKHWSDQDTQGVNLGVLARDAQKKEKERF